MHWQGKGEAQIQGSTSHTRGDAVVTSQQVSGTKQSFFVQEICNGHVHFVHMIFSLARSCMLKGSSHSHAQSPLWRSYNSAPRPSLRQACLAYECATIRCRKSCCKSLHPTCSDWVILATKHDCFQVGDAQLGASRTVQSSTTSAMRRNLIAQCSTQAPSYCACAVPPILCGEAVVRSK